MVNPPPIKLKTQENNYLIYRNDKTNDENNGSVPGTTSVGTVWKAHFKCFCFCLKLVALLEMILS